MVFHPNVLLELNHHRYTDCDMSVTIMDGGIDVRYWVKSYKSSIGDAGKERLRVRLTGLSCHVYNTRSKYAMMRTLANMTNLTFDTPGNSLYDVEWVPDDKEFPKTEIPAFLKVIPVVRINITGGRFIAGNHTLPSLAYLSFRKADFSTYVDVNDDARIPDPYAHVVKGRFKAFKLRIMPNESYNGSLGLGTEARYVPRASPFRPLSMMSCDAQGYLWQAGLGRPWPAIGQPWSVQLRLQSLGPLKHPTCSFVLLHLILNTQCDAKTQKERSFSLTVFIASIRSLFLLCFGHSHYQDTT